MIRESLRIRNLGPLADAFMNDIRPAMVLVGATGTGKSLILKVLSMMRHVCKKQIVRRALKKSGVSRTSFRIRTDTYLNFADIGHLVVDQTKITYEIHDGEFCCTVILDKKGFRTDFGPSEDSGAVGPFFKLAFISDSRNLLATWARKGAAIQSKVLDNFFGETFSLWETAMNGREGTTPGLGFLNAKLSVSRGDEGARRVYIVDSTGHRTLFERGASGERASIPVAVILRYLVSGFSFEEAIKRSYLKDIIEDMMRKGKDDLSQVPGRKVATFSKNLLCVHVEEPELSLDPETQLLFADDLVKTLDLTMEKNSPAAASIFFTTHSPYWVTALNTIAEEGASTFLTWERLGGYWVRADGTLQSLRDEEGRLLLTPNMDDATRKLDDRYNDALEKNQEAM